jgi:hypothetical protein
LPLTRHLHRWFLSAALIALAACSSGGDAPALRMEMSGGRGRTGAGGSGGELWAYSYGGDVAVRTGGALPALPSYTYVAPALGDNPLTVSSSTTLTVGGALVGDDGVNPATGLWVKRGVTLELVPGEGSSTVWFTLSAGLLVDGTLRLAATPGTLDSASLEISAASGAISSSGRIDASGLDGDAETDGGDAGYVDLEIQGDFYNRGTIVTRGGKGANGGSGSSLDVTVASGWVVNTGVADSSGGQGLAGVGGSAGGTEIWGRWSEGGTGSAYNSGELVARGGDGSTGGGNGGWVYFSGCQHGWTVSTGVLDGSGGDATVDGPGGAANGIDVEASGDQVFVKGMLRARGGNGAGAGAGGDGESAGVSSNEAWSGTNERLGVWLAATVDVSGGDGATGGGAGELEVMDDGMGDTAGVHLLGYATLSARGGDGATAGGAGGSLELYSYRYWGEVPEGTPLIGSVTNEAVLDVRGGVGADGAGGSGGYAGVHTEYDGGGIEALDRSVASKGKILAGGGDGTTEGGWGGYVYLYDHFLLESVAPIDVSGGDGGTGAGGGGGTVEASGELVVKVTGDIDASGGAGATPGGTGRVTIGSAPVYLVRGVYQP